MIEPDMRSAMIRLHQEGMPLREICKRLHVSRNTVRRIVRGAARSKNRTDKIDVDSELIRRLHHECDGWGRRMHEKLVEEEGIRIGYSTLTRLIRELGLGRRQNSRCDRVPDEPGAEMQHDTTIYQVRLDGRRVRLVASILYLRYSKRRYLKFYRSFNRFSMKCFLHEALIFWEHSARVCIIDNTNLARLAGSGSSAVICPEMAAFSDRYGFEFRCHAIDHPNRKAGNERSFWTTETNFLKGRVFESLEDLNDQARQWATVRMEHRALTKAGLIPAKAFEVERSHLHRLPKSMPGPYRVHRRAVNQYGYVEFGGNSYWTPGTDRPPVKVFEYADRLTIHRDHTLLAEYPLPADGTRNEHFSPPGEPKPKHAPRKRHRTARQEDAVLRGMGEEVASYLDFAVKSPGIQRHRFTRQLHALSRKLTKDVFIRTVVRALQYRIVKPQTLERIAWQLIGQGDRQLPPVEVDDSYQDRESYREGRLTDEPDLSIYDREIEREEEKDDRKEKENDQ